MADVNEYLDLLDDDSASNKQRLKSSLYSSADSSPDAESALVKISKRSGIPVEALRLDNGAEAKRRVSADHADALLKDSPVAAEFLAKPHNAQVSHDDIEALTGLEKIFTGFFSPGRMAEGVYNLVHSGKSKSVGKALLEGAYASPDLASEALARTGQKAAEVLDWSLQAFPDELGIRKKVSNIAKESADYWKKSAAKKLTQYAPGSVESYAQQAGSSIGLSMLSAPFGVAGSGGALAMFGLMTEGGYQDMRDAGVSVPQAALLSTSNQVMEALTEKIGIDRLTKGSGPLLKKMAQFLVGDLGGEEVNTLYNAMVDKVTVRPDMSMGDLMQQMIDTAIVTSIAGPVQGATYHGVAKASETLYDKYVQHQRVTQTTNFLTALGDGAKASKTFQRLPEKVQELVKSLKEKAGGSVDNVYIPADRWSMLWQDAGVEPGDMAEEVIGDRKQYQDALAANSDIVIPLENFIKLAGHEKYGEIVQDVRLAPGDMTAREFEEWNSTRDEEIGRIVSEMQGDEYGSEQITSQLQRNRTDNIFRRLDSLLNNADLVDRSHIPGYQEMRNRGGVTAALDTATGKLQIDQQSVDDIHVAIKAGRFDIAEAILNRLDSAVAHESIHDFIYNNGAYNQNFTDFINTIKTSLANEMAPYQGRKEWLKIGLKHLLSIETYRKQFESYGVDLSGDITEQINSVINNDGAMVLAANELLAGHGNTRDALTEDEHKDYAQTRQTILRKLGVDEKIAGADFLTFLDREHADWLNNPKKETLSLQSSEKSARQVYDDVLGQLIAVGTERSAAERQAMLWQATLRTMGARAGIDPMELYRQYAPKIVRPLPEVLAKRMSVDMQIDPLLDRLRAGDLGAKEADIFGPSLIEFIRSKGGLKDSGGELKAMDAKKLIKNGGMELDRAREAAVEAGYLEQDSTVRDLLDALDGEMRGRPRYAPGNQNNTLLEEREALAQFREFLDQSNIDLAEMDNEAVRKVLGQGVLFQSGVTLPEKIEIDGIKRWTVNSEGKPIARNEEGIRNFWKWFKDSKVVDKQGRPLVVFHGSPDVRGLFKEGFAAQLGRKDSFFATDSYKMANSYADATRAFDYQNAEDYTIAIYISLQNPMIVDANNAFWMETEKHIAEARDGGYDGIIIKNSVDYYTKDKGSRAATVYSFFNPTAAKSAMNGKALSRVDRSTLVEDASNRGTFDPANPNILFQEDATKRGFFDLSNNTIGLLENADLSTFLHESAHFYFQVLQDLASRPDAPQQIKDDYQLLLDWFGTDQPQTEHLEMFARGFEQYLGEGKAPTPELQSAFQRFKAWIVQVYRNLKNLNVPLSDEVRGVFDRLLATDEEIAQARDNAGVKPLFATAEDAGMTEAEFAAYQKDALAAGVREEERLTAQLMKEYQREQEEWWKNRREGMRLLVEQEAKQNPVYEVLHLLTTGQTFDGSEAEPIKLSKDELVRRYGKEFLKRLPRGFHHIYTVDGGTSIDMVAEMYGFESGDDLIKQMIEAPKMKDWIEAETDVRMRQEYGDKMTDGTITEDALAAVHSDERARILRAELAAIRKKMREVKPYTDAVKADEKEERARMQREREYEMRWMEAEKKLAVAIERGAMRAEIDELRAEMKAAKAMLTAMRRDMFAGIPPVDAFKEAARLTIGQKKIFDLDPNSYLRAEQKAANKAFRAAAKNDFATAGEAKQQQLLNHFLYREARKAKDDAEKIYKHVKKIQTTAGQERIAKGGAQFLEQINSLLEMFQFQRASKRELEKRESLEKWAERMEEEGLIIPIDDKIFNMDEPLNYRQATVEELRAFYDALRTIETTAKHYREFRTANEALEWENVKDDLIVSVLNTDMKSTGELSRANKKSLNLKDRGAAAWREFDASMLKMEQIVEWLDNGKINGPWAKYFFDLADHAQTKEYDYHAKITKQLQDLHDSMPKGWNNTVMDKLDMALPGIHPDDRTRYTLISIALNTGNESNMQRLMDGNRWNETVLDEALQKLSADDWKYIQGVWDIVDSLWPDIVELQERVAGVPPKKVEAREFTNQHGTFRGGYFPMAYDPLTSLAGEKQFASTSTVEEFMSQRYGRASTSTGHLKGRLETVNSRPLLDYEHVLAGHMAKVVKDLSHREAVFYINRILKDPEIKSILIDRLGNAYHTEMNAWLHTLVADRADSMTQNMGWSRNLMRGARTNTAIVAMGFKIMTAMSQFIGFGQSVDMVGYRNMTKGLIQFLHHPKQAWAMVSEKSGEMRHRSQTIERDVKDQLMKIRGKKTKRAAVQRSAFYLIAMADRIVSVPTWIAGYNKALGEGLTEEDAIRMGDRAVRMSQGSGGAKDLAEVQRENDLMKMLTMYYTPFSVMYSRMRDIGHTTKTPKDLPRAVARSLALVIFPAVLGDLVVGRGPDDDEDPVWWAARKILLYPFQAIPIIRDGVNYLERKATGKYTSGYKLSPIEDSVAKVVRAVENLDDAWDGSKEWDDVAWDAFEASGYIFGLPTAQTRITGEYLEDLLTDGENTDKLSGVLFRRVKGR